VLSKLFLLSWPQVGRQLCPQRLFCLVQFSIGCPLSEMIRGRLSCHATIAPCSLRHLFLPAFFFFFFFSLGIKRASEFLWHVDHQILPSW
jgi:hypothetical protein